MNNHIYHCHDCNKDFPIKSYISKDLKKLNKKAYCPSCNKNNTDKLGNIRSQKKSGALSDAPTEAQLKYIQALGGEPGTVKTKGGAGELIYRLKKLKG
jgi:DNA-directed RNA polymerase subunit RPC12/RpoP